MMGSWTRQPASQPAVTACSLKRRSAKTRIASSGANKMTMLMEAAVMKATTKAAALPAPVRGRHSTAQNIASSR